MTTRYMHEMAAAIHAQRRFAERCGAELPIDAYFRMVRVIAAGDAPAFAATADGIRIFQVRYAGVTAYAIWKAELKRIATFYPSTDWITAKGGRLLRDEVSA